MERLGSYHSSIVGWNLHVRTYSIMRADSKVEWKDLIELKREFYCVLIAPSPISLSCPWKPFRLIHLERFYKWIAQLDPMTVLSGRSESGMIFFLRMFFWSCGVWWLVHARPQDYPLPRGADSPSRTSFQSGPLELPNETELIHHLAFLNRDWYA
jgi:hypothetical protein